MIKITKIVFPRSRIKVNSNFFLHKNTNKKLFIKTFSFFLLNLQQLSKIKKMLFKDQV